MEENLISTATSERICSHMNNEHKDALISYAIFYGGFRKPNEVQMVTITSSSLNLMVDGIPTRINFDHSLKDGADAHKTLVSMLKSIK